jgi:hypothetical protein
MAFPPGPAARQARQAPGDTHDGSARVVVGLMTRRLGRIQTRPGQMLQNAWLPSGPNAACSMQHACTQGLVQQHTAEVQQIGRRVSDDRPLVPIFARPSRLPSNQE